MPLRTALSNQLLRWRYPTLLLWSLPWLLHGLRFREPHGDWLYLEIGARTLVHHRQTSIAGPALHLYVTNFEVQMGPPALLLGAPFEWLPEQLGGHLAGVFLALLLLPSLWLIERAVGVGLGARAVQTRLLLAGLVAVPVWTYETEYWGHIDDVLALLAMAAACFLVSRGDHEVLAGVILGTGVAAKPWAVILLPLLFAYARPQRPRAVLAFVVAALGWWLPFVLADPATVHALGTLRLFMVNGPTWHLFGLGTGRAPGWIRPVQLLGGLGLSTVVVRRCGWQAVPIVAMAWRVTTDPYDWPYYALGPLLGAVLWDAQRRAGGRWSLVPWATLSALVVEFVVERELHQAAPALRLVWFVGLTASVLAGARTARITERQASASAQSPGWDSFRSEASAPMDTARPVTAPIAS